MTDKFFEKNKVTQTGQPLNTACIVALNISELDGLFSFLAKVTFEHGLFRVHSIETSIFWSNYMSKLFGSSLDNYRSFMFDWMGREYMINTENEQLALVDPSTMEILYMNQDLAGFFNEDLIEFRNDTLNAEIFNKLQIISKTDLAFENCYGFKKPLFLGGQNVLSNYEVIDREVYWDISYQIFEKIRNLPNGTIITDVRI